MMSRLTWLKQILHTGVLAVVRSNKAQERPYTGLTEIKSGEVAEDLAAYLADSEQANSALALGVSILRDTSVRAAGGYLIQVWHQLLPPCACIIAQTTWHVVTRQRTLWHSGCASFQFLQGNVCESSWRLPHTGLDLHSSSLAALYLPLIHWPGRELMHQNGRQALPHRLRQVVALSARLHKAHTKRQPDIASASQKSRHDPGYVMSSSGGSLL